MDIPKVDAPKANAPKAEIPDIEDSLPTPAPAAPAVRAEAISPKGRETLELIKRKQMAPGPQSDPPSMSMDKNVTGSKYISTGSSAQIPVMPSTRAPMPRSRPVGALNETPAPPRPNNAGAIRRPSTPNMGMPLPPRQAMGQQVAQPMAAPNPMPRRGSGGLIAPAVRPTPMPIEVAQHNAPKAAPPERSASWVTMLMVTIGAFCIGMLALVYFTRK